MTITVKTLEKKWMIFRKHFEVTSTAALYNIGDAIVNLAFFFAPKWKGELAAGIHFAITPMKDGKGRISISNDVPYAGEQETGVGLPELRGVTPLMMEWAKDKGYMRAMKSPLWLVKSFTPHIAPAIEAIRKAVIDEEMLNAIGKSLSVARLDRMEHIYLNKGGG